MPDLLPETLTFFTRTLEKYNRCAHVPFSGKPESALIMLEDGQWMPGVRVDSASYSLTIPALLNAYTTLRTCTEKRISAVGMNRPLRPEELTYLSGISDEQLYKINDRMYCVGESELPAPFPEPMDPLMDAAPPSTPEEGIELARTLIRTAYVPESDFPVACLFETKEGRLIPGVNIEHPDWSRILCAERNALGTAVTFGCSPIKNIYLTCSKDPQCSPCGACRQLLAELTPEAVLWMDRDSGQGETATPDSLLPAWFTGNALINKQPDR